jgi:hypothetical protein
MPTEDQVKRALELIRKPGADANYVRFFTRLSDPAWIVPLRYAGFFVSPPAPVTVGDGVAYPGWPESDYLLRVAGEASAEVGALLPEIPLTENPRVNADLARIAAQLPERPAMAFVKREIEWLGARHHLPLDVPMAIADLALHIADLGKTKRASELLEALLTTRVVPGTQEGWGPRVESRMDGWTYQRLLADYLPKFHGSLGLSLVRLLADLLDNSLQATSGEAPHDYSEIWRRSLIDDPEVYLDDPRQALITGLRLVAIGEANTTQECLTEVLDIFAEHDWSVFRRLELSVLAETEGAGSPVVAAYLLDVGRLNDPAVGREYSALLEKTFQGLEPTQRTHWLALVDEGPTWPPRDAEERKAKEISDEYYESYVASWKRNWYAQVRAHLERDRQNEIDRLEARYGAAQSPAAVGETQSWVGPTSPLSDEQLRDKSASDIVRFLKTWEPSGEPMSPSPEGLARLLTERVAAGPSEFAAVADAIGTLEPTYVRAALQGFEKAVKNEHDFEWPAVLTLAEVAIGGRPIGVDQGERWLDRDAGWSWARGAIADLLTTALRAEKLPQDLGDRAWALLEELSWDDDPTPEHERRYGGNNMDPLTLSLNTTRGKAMHAVLAFALWRKTQAGENDSFSLTQTPEVAANLEAHLDPTREPSETVRGVFGASLNQMLWLDRAWLEAHITALFPADESLAALRRAAWESYLSWGGQPFHLFPLLESQYRQAITELPASTEDRSRIGRAPGTVLAEHLGIFYYNNRIDLAAGGLVDLFFSHASDAERAHLVEFLGRSLQQADEDAVPAQVLTRMVDLWKWITDKVSTDRDVVLAPFAWWYGAAVLDQQWRNEQLIALLRTKVPVSPDFVLVRAFTESSAADLSATLNAIYLYLQAERDRWRLLGARDDLRAILARGAAGDAEQRSKARDIVNLLAARGVMDVLDLAPDTP